MSISFSGLGSGLPIDEWITKLVAVEQAKVDTLNTQRETITKKQSALNTLKSEYSAVQSAANKFTDCLFGAGMDFFSKVGVKVSGQDEKNPIVSATVTQYSTPSSIDLEVKTLATATVRTSAYFDAFKQSSNKLSELGVTSEDTFQINDATISIKPDMTIDSLVYQINNSAQAGVKASLKGGKLVLENRETGAKEMNVSGDFASKLGLDSNEPYSVKTKSYADLSSDVNLAALGVSYAGTATINGKSFSFSPNMYMPEFFTSVNNALSGSGVSMKHVDNGDSTWSFALVNNDKSDKPITLSGDRFATELFKGLGFKETSTVKNGTDAVFTINGETKTSSTNTINSDTTGVLGLSLVLSGTTNGTPLTIDISRDYDSEEPFEAIQSFVDAFNKMIVDSKASTDSENGGLLSGENTLNNLRTNLRSMITSPVSNSGIYRSLADIGITTGAPGLDVDADTTQLIIDKDKFMEAFKKDPNSVKALLIGDTEDGIGKGNGLMQQVQESLTPALDSKYGYFSARTESFEAQLKNMDEKIEKKKEYVTRYQEKLTKQFTYMDNLIAQMNNQFSQMQQQLASIGVDVGGSSS